MKDVLPRICKCELDEKHPHKHGAKPVGHAAVAWSGLNTCRYYVDIDTPGPQYFWSCECEAIVTNSNTPKYEPVGRRFILHRIKDISGISGTGIVAEGWLDPLGEAIIVWIVGTHKSTEIHHSIDALMAIHGHNGSTELVWIDK